MSRQTVDPVDHLSRLSEDELVELLRLRPDLTRGRLDDLDTLARRACSPRSLGLAWLEVDAGVQLVVEALCALGPSEPTRLARVLGREEAPASVLAALERARRRGLVSGLGDCWAPAPGLAPLLPAPLGLGPSVRSLGMTVPLEVLRSAAAHAGISNGGRRDLIIEALVDRFTEPGVVAELLAGVPHPGPSLVEMAIESGGLALDADERLVMVPELHQLLDRLLLVTDGRSLIVPCEVALAVTGERLVVGAPLDPPPSPDRRGLALERVLAGAGARASTLVGAVEALLVELGRQPLSLLRNGSGVGVREMRRLARELAVDELIAARLVELAVGAGLVTSEDGAVSPSPLAERWEERERPARWSALVRSWWVDERHHSAARHPSGSGAARPVASGWSPLGDVGAARRQLVSALAGIEPGRAVDRGALAAWWRWWYPAHRGADEVETAELVDDLIDEAELLGLVEDDCPTPALRALARFDDAALDRAAVELVPSESDAVVAQPDGTLTALGPPSPALGRELARLAVRMESSGATVWRVTPESVRRALDGGLQAEDLVAILERVAVGGVPQPVRYLVSDVARRHGHLRVGSVSSVLVADDEDLLIEVLGSRMAERLGLRPVAPTVAVSPEPAERLLDALRRAGYLPVVAGWGQLRLEGAEETDDATDSESGPPAGWDVMDSGTSPDAAELSALVGGLGRRDEAPRPSGPPPPALRADLAALLAEQVRPAVIWTRSGADGLVEEQGWLDAVGEQGIVVVLPWGGTRRLSWSTLVRVEAVGSDEQGDEAGELG